MSVLVVNYRSVAIERETPLSGVLHAHATDVREAGRRARSSPEPARRSR